MSHSPSAPETSAHSSQPSCATCRRRKVRCDKRTPCTPCSRGGHGCSYRPSEPRARRVRKATINDVATRISQLEKTLCAVSPGHAFLETPPTTSTPPGSGPRHASPGGEILLEKGSSSQYFNEVLVSRVIEQEHDVRTALATPSSGQASQPQPPSPFNPMGILSSPDAPQTVTDFHPSKLIAMQLWKVFIDTVDSCIKIVHVPTTEVIVYTVLDDPANASMEDLALCFAIYYAATMAMDPTSSCTTVLMDDWGASLQRFKTGLEQALAHADFLENPTVILLQAMAIYLTAVRVHNSGRAVWTLNGLAMRAAQSIGLHRDGKKLGLSPFESEVRRRLWWYFLGREGRAAEDYGLNNTSCLSAEADVPLNLEDSDLFPEMTELPPSRRGWTRMTMSLACIRIGRAYAELQLHDASPPGQRRDFRDRVVRDLRSAVEDMLRGCNPVIPSHRMSLLTARFIIRKLDFVTRQQWQAMKHRNEQEMLATEDSLLEALDLLEEDQRIRADDLLQPFYWSMRLYPQFSLTLFVLWHVCVRPAGPNAHRAIETVDRYVDAMESTRKYLLRGSKWTILKALRIRAVAMLPSQQRAGADAKIVVSRDQASSNGIALGSVTSGGFGEVVDAGMADDLHFLPGWSTLVQDFIQDEMSFSVIL